MIITILLYIRNQVHLADAKKVENGKTYIKGNYKGGEGAVSSIKSHLVRDVSAYRFYDPRSHIIFELRY
jgi:hypothetical protein